MNIEYVCTNMHKENFYNMVGPFLGNRQAAKDLGMPVWNDPGREWVIAIVNGCPAACSSIEFGKSGRATLKSAWVQKEFRGQGIYTELLRRRIDIAQAQGVKILSATATSLSLEILLRHGFRQTGSKGKYFLLQKEVECN